MQASLPSKVRFLLLQANKPCSATLDEAGQGQGIQMYPCHWRERNNVSSIQSFLAEKFLYLDFHKY